MTTITGQFVDLGTRSIFPASVTINAGRISAIKKLAEAPDHYIMPGFIDAHIHIESSMLVPSEFAKIAVTFGTVATVSDPHEIANVCGVAGVDFMVHNAGQSPLKFYFGAPSCVPATPFETAGAVIDVGAIQSLMDRAEIHYLAEMMNFPGVLMQDQTVMAKIAVAQKSGKPVDGHAPGLRGMQAGRYAAAGMSTDHECVSLEEALDKIAAGMYILIREGSAAKNFEALIDLLRLHPGKVMFCSDDKHPDELIKGHINQLVARAVSMGYDLFDVLHAACVLPVAHYSLEVGLLKEGDAADFIVVKNLKDFEVISTYIDGTMVAGDGHCMMSSPAIPVINNFAIKERRPEDFGISAPVDQEHIKVKVIDALDGQLITTASEETLEIINGKVLQDVRKDVLKIGVVNRYHDAAPALGFVRQFGLKQGAIASSVAHDSHNIVFVGVDDESICAAVNAVIQQRGGISVCDGTKTAIMPLPVAGLMSDKDAQSVAGHYKALDSSARLLGSKLRAPFMTLSFMALPVIPSLKITDKGLFDVDQFDFTPLFIS